MIIKGYLRSKIRGAHDAAEKECSHIYRATPLAYFKFIGYGPDNLSDIYYHRKPLALSEKAFTSFMQEMEEGLSRCSPDIRWQRVLTRNLKAIKPTLIDLGWMDRAGFYDEEQQMLLKQALER